MPHHWRHSRSGWTGLWATRSSWRQPYSLQGGWTRWPLKVPSNSNYSVILWIYDSMIISSEKLNYASRRTMSINLYCDSSSHSERSSQFSDFWLKSSETWWEVQFTCFLMDFWWRIINLHSGQKSSPEETLGSCIACESQAIEKNFGRWFQGQWRIIGKRCGLLLKFTSTFPSEAMWYSLVGK